MSLRPDCQRFKRAAETKGRIFAAARANFERFGYVGADIRSIARDAGSSTGALFAYWPDKPALWRDVMGDEALTALFGAGA